MREVGRMLLLTWWVVQSNDFGRIDHGHYVLVDHTNSQFKFVTCTMWSDAHCSWKEHFWFQRAETPLVTKICFNINNTAEAGSWTQWHLPINVFYRQSTVEKWQHVELKGRRRQASWEVGRVLPLAWWHCAIILASLIGCECHYISFEYECVKIRHVRLWNKGRHECSLMQQTKRLSSCINDL